MPATISPTITYAAKGHRAYLTLMREAAHNRLRESDLVQLETLIEEINQAEDIRVAILTGSGSKCFCAGFEISDIEATDWQDNQFGRTIGRLEAARPAVICALNGSVYGGACEIALACDFRIGVSGMEMRMPPAKLGLIYFAPGLKRLVSRIGLGATKRLLLTAETMDAETLLEIGFLDRLVAPEALATESEALAARIEALSPLAVQGMKKLLNDIAAGELDAAAADRSALESFRSEDAKEGIRAFKEKRTPRFSGR